MINVSVILPCLNEEESIGHSIKKIQDIFVRNNIDGEIIVVDNGSTDNSASIAKKYEIKYVFEPKRGYGNAYLTGFKHAKGKYLILGDPDNSYDFDEIPNFLLNLKNSDIVLGSRFLGKIEKGAMPSLHRYIGNPGLRLLFRILYGLNVSESSIGCVGLRKEALKRLHLKEPGMEFSSEMLVKAKKNNLKLKEIPINYYRRSGKSKLRTFRDGFRHLHFLIKERLN